MAEIELPNPEELGEEKAKTFTRRVALTTAIIRGLAGHHLPGGE